MNIRRTAIPLLLTLVLTACETVPSKQDQGMLIGAVVGGIVGNQIGDGTGQVIATMVGAVAGAAIGGSIGRSMDDVDRLKAAYTFENVQTGVPTRWVNPDTRNEYTLVPTRTYETAQGPCREYTMDAVIGGTPQQVYGTACRQPDGTWRVIN